MRNYTVDGEVGPINKIVNFKNELYGFQDIGIFNIRHNRQAAITTDVGEEITIGSTGSVQGVKYVTKYTGCTNK
jgi:hypothetical protein